MGTNILSSYEVKFLSIYSLDLISNYVFQHSTLISSATQISEHIVYKLFVIQEGVHDESNFIRVFYYLGKTCKDISESH